MIKTILALSCIQKGSHFFDQLQMGTRDTLMIESFVIMHPLRSCLCFLCHHLCLTLPHLFSWTVIINYSLIGSNNRTADESVILHWNDYILECEGKIVVDIIVKYKNHTLYHTLKIVNLYYYSLQ